MSKLIEEITISELMKMTRDLKNEFYNEVGEMDFTFDFDIPSGIFTHCNMAFNIFYPSVTRFNSYGPYESRTLVDFDLVPTDDCLRDVFRFRINNDISKIREKIKEDHNERD